MKPSVPGPLVLALSLAAILSIGCGGGGASSPPTLGPVQVVQDPERNYTFSWAAAGPTATTPVVQVTGGPAPDAVAASPILGTASGGTVLTIGGLDPSHRWYFRIAPVGGAATPVAVRQVALSGPVNLRDLGGYPTADGRQTRWGVYFRSDQLSTLTAADASYLANSAILHDVDLRMDSEVAAAPDLPAADSRFTYDRRPMAVMAMATQNILQSGTVFDEAAMVKAYEQCLASYASTFADVFRSLADHGAGTVFHCVYGKDRTGMVAALLLMAANVPDSCIVNDYHLTDQYEAVEEAAFVAQAAASLPPAQAALLGVSFYAPPAVMQAVLTHVRQTYGSAAGYLQTGGLDAATLARVVSAFVQ